MTYVEVGALGFPGKANSPGAAARFELIVNLTSAKVLAVPPTLLAQTR